MEYFGAYVTESGKHGWRIHPRNSPIETEEDLRHFESQLADWAGEPVTLTSFPHLMSGDDDIET